MKLLSEHPLSVINLIFAVFLAVCLPGSAVAQDIKFHHITPDEGLGSGNVWAILEDHEGFMWFGTEDGLVRYDGYNLVDYKYKRDDSTTISANFVVTLLEDRFGQIWAGTFGGGLNRYNRDSDSFTRFVHDSNDQNSLPHNRIKSLLESKDGKIWVGTEGAGIATFNPDPVNSNTIKFEKFQPQQFDHNDPNELMIRSIAEDPSGNIYIGTLAGIIIIDTDRERITRLKQGNNFPNILSSNQILEVFIDSNNRIWFGTLNEGLDLYLPQQHKVINYSPSENKYTLRHPEIETIAEDQFGNLWIGTDDGLSRLSKTAEVVPPNRFINYSHHTLDDNSLLSNSIKIVYVDSRNALWVGSYYGGINVYNPDLYKFTPRRSKPWLRNTLSHDNVTTFAEDQEGNLWIGTDGGGVNLLKGGSINIFSENYENIQVQRFNNSPPETKTKTLAFDREGNLWIGFWVGGLFRFNPNTGESVYYGPGDHSDSGLSGIRILDLAVDDSDNLWVATFDAGISYYNKSKGTFKNYLTGKQGAGSVQGERFNSIIIDSKKRVWAGGDLGGLNLYYPELDQFQAIDIDNKLLNDISILDIFEKSNGDICIGTQASGLIIYSPNIGKIVNFNEGTGLPGVIHGILEDNSENLWLSTNQGIVKLNPKDSSFSRFAKEDGLQGNQFNNGSCLQLSNGQLVFGGIKGWNGFYPENIRKREAREKIVYTNIWINGELVELNKPNAVLSAHINSQNAITLSHTQKSFILEFAILDYDFSNLNRYAYYLEGFDTDWQYIGTDRKAVFNNMQPGKYKLHLKATNHDGFWVEKPEVLVIDVIPAFWQTKPFKVSLGIAVLLLAYFIYRLRINFLVNQHKKLEALVQVRTTEIESKNRELNDKNNEILAQNEELFAQNEQISQQREALEKAQAELSSINQQLEKIVKSRTVKLEKTIKQLDKTVVELDRFVYSASHDLSAPLKSVRGLIELLKVEKDPDIIADCLQHMTRSVESLEEVIRNLVDYSRNAHLDIEQSTVNCKEIVGEVCNELRYWPESRQVHIENMVPAELVKTDPGRLKIILHNLISNAMKYADPEKQKPMVQIEYHTNDKHWGLKVSDNGIGIEKGHLGKIFNMYYRASENSKGSGLGLFIVRESIAKLKGKIQVESVKGQGTSFALEFPKK